MVIQGSDMEDHYAQNIFYSILFYSVPGETGKTLQKGCFYVVVSQGNSGNKVEKW